VAINADKGIDKQIEKAGLPTGGSIPFIPKLDKNKKGKQVIKKGMVQGGPWKSKKTAARKDVPGLATTESRFRNC
jgi:hypothetical protein